VIDNDMSAGLLSGDVLSPRDAAQVAALDAVRERLVADARSWAAQLDELTGIALRAEQDGAQVRRTLALELAGSWRIGQLTAERWLAEAERLAGALPLTLSMLRSGSLLRHQASTLEPTTQDRPPHPATTPTPATTAGHAGPRRHPAARPAQPTQATTAAAPAGHRLARRPAVLRSLCHVRGDGASGDGA
jgi:hypothetical protein